MEKLKEEKGACVWDRGRYKRSMHYALRNKRRSKVEVQKKKETTKEQKGKRRRQPITPRVIRGVDKRRFASNEAYAPKPWLSRFVGLNQDCNIRSDYLLLISYHLG